MSASTWKNYRLRDASELGDVSDGPEAPVWYTPKIDRKTLKGLMKRRDGSALRDYGIWVALVIALGAAKVALWGSVSGIVALLAYSVVHQSATARQHELGHGTPFKTRWLNDLLFHLTSFITLSEGHYYRWRHARHHTHTIIVGKDPEIQSVRPPEIATLLINIFNLKTVVVSTRDFLRRAGGDLGDGVHFIPETEQRKVIIAARIYLILILAIAAVSVLLQSWLPLLLTVGPRIIGAPLYAFLHFTQHAGLDEDVFDHRLNSRTVLMNPILRFLYCNMNYHIEHHIFPMVPYYRLPELHDLIKHECPEPKRGLVDAYRDIIPTLLRQVGDPAYHIQPALPGGARSSPASA